MQNRVAAFNVLEHMMSTIHTYRNITWCQLQLSSCFIIP